MDRRRKKLDSLVNLYRFCCFKTNFRNNHKYLFGHPLRLDTFKLKRKLTFKKITFLIDLSCKYVQTPVHKLHRLQPYILQGNKIDTFFFN